MKKIIVLYILSIVVVFFMPVFMVKEYDVKEFDINKNEINENDIIIKLLLSETNEVVELSLDEYIMGVLVGEMPVTYELEALKAQAVVARTYTLNKIINSAGSHVNADMCDDINHCQAYKTKEYALTCWDDEEENEKWNKIKTAVLETKNEVITYDDKLINAFFHANSGGKTEDSLNIWGRENIPYLKSVVGNEEDIFLEKVTFTYEEFEKIMTENFLEYDKLIQSSQENPSNDSVNKDIKNDENNSEENHKILIEKNIKILEKNSSGRVSKVKISNITLDGTEVRSLFGLRSTFFDIDMTQNNITFNTKGYGHGIGLSQDGANSMAKKGSLYKDIIQHFYSNVEIKNILSI